MQLAAWPLHVRMSAPVDDLITQCPFCAHDTAVRLGGDDGRSLFACVSCDEEFEIDEPPERVRPDE